MKKVKPVLQFSAVECGACSLSTILRYYGKYEKIGTLRKLLGISRDGSKAKDILRGARELGLEAKGMKLPYAAITEDMLPCIIFWEFNHFLVLEGFKNGRAYLSNPALGRHSVSQEDFIKSYSGVALLLKPGPQFEKSGTPEISLYRRIMGIPLAYPMNSFLILLLGVLAVIPNLFIASSSKEFINQFLSNQRAYFGMPIVIITLLSVVLLVAGSLLSSTLQRRLQYLISKKLSMDLYRKLFAASFSYLGQRSSTELSTRLTMGLSYSASVVGLFYSYGTVLIQCFLVIIFIFLISWQLTLLSLTVISINMIFTYYLVESRSDANKQLNIKSGHASSVGYLSLINIDTIKSSGLEPITLDGWLDAYVPIVDETQMLGNSMNIIGTFSKASTLFLNLSVLVAGGYLILKGNFTLGGLVAFQFLNGSIQAPISALVSIGSALQSVDGMIGRLSDVDESEQSQITGSLSIVNPEDNASNQNLINVDQESIPGIRNIIELKNITYKFGEHLPNFFDGLNLSFRQGSHTTIVGPSGSGKSTLIKIIAGMLEPSEGELIVAGQELKNLTPESRSMILSYVPQDIFIFDTTIKNNLSLWDPSITQEDFNMASKDAEIYMKILELEESFDTRIDAFSNLLSGGQNQRLTIARALSRNSNVLLLDEATSALDDPTEQKVIENIYKRKITTISVAHRLYTALTGDYVIVLDNGHIVEQGTPSKLINDQGLFYQLVEADKNQEVAS